MKRSINKRIIGLLAILTSVGVAQSEGTKLKLPNPTEKQLEIVSDLIQKGVISPIKDYPNWYQIDQQRLSEILEIDQVRTNCNISVCNTINLLKKIVGDEVDIQQVDIFRVRLGTQDSFHTQQKE